MSVDPAMTLEELAPLLKQLIRFSSALNKEDVNFYNSIDSDVKEQSKKVNSALLDGMNNMARSVLSITPDLDHEAMKFNAESDPENMNVLSNTLDTLFENVEISLDKHKNAKAIAGNQNISLSNKLDDTYTYLDETDAQNSGSNNSNSQKRMPQSINMAKPQMKFESKIDNFESHPFKPLITVKPNALKPLEECLKLVEPTEDVPAHYENPYAFEIMNAEYPQWILEPLKNDFESIPWKGSEAAIWIEDPSQLKDLIIDLKNSKVIAIDLEHHDYRTYHGLTCLMQITSESKKDYLIDPLSAHLRPHLPLLNEIFTDPKIVKVLHGAFMDVIWLQRDLGLYLVSLFDTFHASKQLSLGKHSLAFLLEKYVRFRTSKKWQLADWRIRPLSAEMKDYAKADTHFLIEVFHKMHEELLKIPEALQKTLYQSRKVANRRFEYSTFQPKNLQIMKNTNVVSTTSSVPLIPDLQNKLCSFNYVDRDLPWTWMIISNGIPLASRPLLEILFKWRDQKARVKDESPRYIMSDFIMISIVNAIDIVSPNSKPEDVTSTRILDIINSSAKFGGGVVIRKYINELVEVIQNAITELSGFDIGTLNDVSKLPSDEPHSNKVDLSENVYKNIKDVSKLQNDFISLLAVINNKEYEKETNRIQLLKEPSVAFATQYEPSGLTEIDSVSDRVNEIVDFFKEDVAEVVELEVDTADIELEEKEREQRREEQEKKRKVIEEKEEIVTLRSRPKSKSQNNRKTSDQKEKDDMQTDFLDFNKSVMGIATEDKKRGRGKKRGQPTFDPYSKIDSANGDVPQLKKKKRVDRGKNAIFKRR